MAISPEFFGTSPSRIVVQERYDEKQGATKTSPLHPRGLQTTMPPPVGDNPPLLPAFLITGLLLSVICIIIAYRHFVERRRRSERYDDPTWADEDLVDPKAAPTLWEAEVDRREITNGGDWGWDKTMVCRFGARFTLC